MTVTLLSAHIYMSMQEDSCVDDDEVATQTTARTHSRVGSRAGLCPSWSSQPLHRPWADWTPSTASTGWAVHSSHCCQSMDLAVTALSVCLSVCSATAHTHGAHTAGMLCFSLALSSAERLSCCRLVMVDDQARLPHIHHRSTFLSTAATATSPILHHHSSLCPWLVAPDEMLLPLLLLLSLLSLTTSLPHSAAAPSAFPLYSSYAGKPYTVSYDARSLRLNDQPVTFMSGSIHYPRSTPGMWPSLMQQAALDGLNMIEIYVFWNQHEQVEGQLDWSGRGNLTLFLDAIAEAGLFANLRIGPYVCAEWDYGGIPTWLAYKPGMRFRAYNQPWMDAVRKWVGEVITETRTYFADHGGPIVLAQIENELSSNDQQYVQWNGDLAASFNVHVPWVRAAAPHAHTRTHTSPISSASRSVLCRLTRLSFLSSRVPPCPWGRSCATVRLPTTPSTRATATTVRTSSSTTDSPAASSSTSPPCGQRTKAGLRDGPMTLSTRAPTATAHPRTSRTPSSAGSQGEALTRTTTYTHTHTHTRTHTHTHTHTHTPLTPRTPCCTPPHA